ncbi:MerR family transcriptional regulator [Lactobacillus kalixensis]|uniref:Uncharacterized protein n=1 Tax=Lactobacillus kalixensis DSM 16043 TaxID=1423763 RepID=A0A0R1UG91_9LACO|nr:MerR family transcriptional regulator [Lactobacillus kalixensis]KRL90131.1 hypothetical protein FC46_GL000425 [Lactobacillus kalixensis DSM 16043]
MTSNKHNFEELDAPAAASKKLGISVATLRKYSLIVEKVTGNSNYFERTKQKARLYTKKDIEDLDAFYNLAKNSGLTLQEAARQIYAVDQAKEKVEEKETEKNDQLVDTAQMVKLLGALQQTIAHQNNAILELQKQLDRIEKQNKDLIEQQKQLSAPKNDTEIEVDPKIAAMPDISGIVSVNEPKTQTREEKRKEIEADAHKSKTEVHSEILQKAKENAEKRAIENSHRTLADMQLPKEKKHWWQRFLNY